MKPMSNPAQNPENVSAMDPVVRLAYWDYLDRLPGALLQTEWNRVTEEAGGDNVWLFPPIGSADAIPNARVCPDVLYSLLGYDLNPNPLRLSVPISRDAFWSLSLIGHDAEEFYSVDDRLVEGDSLDLVILGPGQSSPSQDDSRVVASPGAFGLAVARIVVPELDSLEALDELRRRATAAPAV
jgi:uncharacterized membrane protein